MPQAQLLPADHPTVRSSVEAITKLGAIPVGGDELALRLLPVLDEYSAGDVVHKVDFWRQFSNALLGYMTADLGDAAARHIFISLGAQQ